MKTTTPLPAKECKKCGSALTEGQAEISLGGSATLEYCSDDACPYSDWPQGIDLDDLQEAPRATVENKYGVKKRVRADGQVKVSLCILAQIRIPVDAPENYAEMDEEELLAWGNTRFRKMLSDGVKMGDFLAGEDDTYVSMIERHPLEHVGCPTCGTENSTEEEGCKECGAPIPAEASDYEVLVTTQEWENFWENPNASAKIVHPGKEKA